MQQWFGYSDAVMEEALYDILVLPSFAGLDAFEDYLPDESTIITFSQYAGEAPIGRSYF
jgi:transposase, IS5 family